MKIWMWIVIWTIPLLVMRGCDSKPYYRINGLYTETYTEKDGCVTYMGTHNKVKICGDYRITPRNGAKLK